MQQQLTNNNGFSLAMAVWLAHDTYTSGVEEHPGKSLISATSLLKSTRQFILSNRVPVEERILDVADLIPSRFGHAIHDSMEMAWREGHAVAMRKLGYPQKIIDRVVINPDTVQDGDFPVYLEQRFFRPINVDGHEIIISGKFDQIINGELNDTKTTSVYAYLNGSKEDDYRIQGSIYRWINPDKVTNDIMKIQHVFTDWQRSQSKSNPNYPPHRVLEFSVELWNTQETEHWIRNKIREILANQNLPEPEITRCSDKELWKSDPVWKYYANPETAKTGGRATKNFPNRPAAMLHMQKAGKGTVIEVPGQVKACGYCPAFDICSQKDEYDHAQ